MSRMRESAFSTAHWRYVLACAVEEATIRTHATLLTCQPLVVREKSVFCPSRAAVLVRFAPLSDLRFTRDASTQTGLAL